MYSMITGGEDALYIARRLVVVASEDVGLADPQGLPLVSYTCPRSFTSLSRLSFTLRQKAMATYQACQVIGLPECRLNLAVSLLSPLHFPPKQSSHHVSG